MSLLLLLPLPPLLSLLASPGLLGVKFMLPLLLRAVKLIILSLTAPLPPVPPPPFPLPPPPPPPPPPPDDDIEGKSLWLCPPLCEGVTNAKFVTGAGPMALSSATGLSGAIGPSVDVFLAGGDEKLAFPPPLVCCLLSCAFLRLKTSSSNLNDIARCFKAESAPTTACIGGGDVLPE